MSTLFKNLFVFFSIIMVLSSCELLDLFNEEEDESATMCYSISGNILSVNCSSNKYGGCDGGSLGTYASWSDCSKDMSAVLETWKTSGVLAAGPNAGSGGGGNNTSTGPSYCTSTYQGPKGEPQRDSFCEAAWLYLCKNGFSPNSQEVKTYCDLYRQQNDISTPKENCPYCK
jgi:hypothetical protein